MMAYATWLADVLRGAGLKVVERPGWQTAGRGPMGEIKGVISHHTGPTGSLDSAIQLIEKGRPDLAGPLSQLVLDTDGTFYVIAAGRCNHAGKGKWQGIVNGNSQFIGIEARNDGDGSVWPAAQMLAYAAGEAAILEHIGADAVMAVGHKEWALPKGRKIDPTFDMIEFREDVEAHMTGGKPAPVPPRTLDPTHAMLRKGDHNYSVYQLQKLLGIKTDSSFGPATDAAVKAFQSAHGLEPDGKVGPKTWAALGVK
jgi:N-acetyl-anhydromuramyl-L-alanine amidase AmpD